MSTSRVATGRLLLIAHGDMRRKGVRPLHERLLAELTTGRAPNVVYLGAASDDDPGYARGMARFFGELGARFSHLKTFGREATPADEALRLLAGADLVYLGGGDVEACVGTLGSRGLVAPLRARYLAGGTIAGASAGSIALCACWVSFPEPIPSPPPPHDGATIFPCLAVLPDLVCDTHAEEDDWDELRILLALLAERDGEERWTGFGIPSSGALEIRPGTAPRSVGLDPCVPLAVRDGRVVIAPR